jgi:hypothetical protein
MEKQLTEPEFAPVDLTDGKKAGEWKTYYLDPQAQKGIRFEGIYVTSVLFACPVLLMVLWLVPLDAILPIKVEKCGVLCRYGYAWIGGLLGGTLYTMKWLYHSVAKGMWHRDRRLWRLLAPHLSAALAFVFICMVQSGILLVFDRNVTRQPSAIVAMAFLVGYFSDTALAKMSEIAMSLFGTAGKASAFAEAPREGKTANPRADNNA